MLSLSIRSSKTRHHSNGNSTSSWGHPPKTAYLLNELFNVAVARRPSRVALLHRPMVCPTPSLTKASHVESKRCSYKALQCLKNNQSCFLLVKRLLNPMKGRFYGFLRLVSIPVGMQWHNFKYPSTRLFAALRTIMNYVGLMGPL